MNANALRTICLGSALLLLSSTRSAAQGQWEQLHQRGRLWEAVQNDGWIGNLCAWDFCTSDPMGLFPGFDGFVHPIGGETNAYDWVFVNANMHNFRSGCWILAKDLQEPGAPPSYAPEPASYEIYHSGLQIDTYGAEAVRPPAILLKNYAENEGFNPRLPEEMIVTTWNTNTGITVMRRSYVWSFPGYQDFIIYDYQFTNTGKIVANSTGQVVPGFPQQTLSGVYFVFHSGVSVSTKSQINFHDALNGVAAGGFGWLPDTFHDFYHVEENNTLVYSTNYNGGKSPPPWDREVMKVGEAWQDKFGAELQSPAAFGWLALYADAVSGGARPSPRPDVLRVDSHKNGTFQGKDLNLEKFVHPGLAKKTFYDFAQAPDTQIALGNSGNRLNFYTFSYGPYTLAPGDSVRIILAEIAGVMDYNEVNAGDPDHHFPDSTIAAIRRNAANARNAVRWGIGATENGIPLAADVPEPPPGPRVDALNASVGVHKAAIAVTWDKTAENAQMTDGAGNIYYRGLADLDGYRIYRSTDFQYVSEEEKPVFRGAAWQLLADIPKSDLSVFEDAATGNYKYLDSAVAFGFRYGYYVSAYRNAGATWTSANGTAVPALPAMMSGDYNRTPPTAARPGPATTFDIFVVPNPYVYNDPLRSFGMTSPYEVQIYNLPERCMLRIYTISGDLVRTIVHQPDARGNKFGSESWDQKSDSGLLVAPGLYVYNVQSTTPGLPGTFTGKLMIIR